MGRTCEPAVPGARARPRQRTASGTAPAKPGDPARDALFACVAGYWEAVNVMTPVVHRGAVEEAFLAGTSAVYGRRPAALLAAIAASGARAAELPGTTVEDRVRLGESYAATARAMLEAALGSLREAAPAGSPRGEDPPMNALETLQARVLLARYYTVERDATATGWFADGQVPRLLPAGLRPGGFLSRDWAPNDAAEWLTGELMLRCIVVWGLRGMYDSVYAGRPQAHDILAFPLPAPCSDVVFSLPALEAFERVRTPGGGPIRRPLLDPRPLRELSPPLDAGAALVRAAVAPIFEMRAGRLSLLLLVQYLCALFVRLRDHAAAHGVDPVALASSPPELDTPPGAAFRNGCRILDFLLAQIYDQLPADIGPALLAGDPGPFFARSAAIGGPPGAHAMLPYFIALRALPIAAWVRGDPASAGAAFFASAPLASALESGIVAADLMRAQLRLDPELRCSGAFAFMPAMKIGALGAAVAAVAGGDAAAQGAEDARAAAAYLRALVVNAPTGRPQLDAFNGMLGRLGIAAPGGSPAQGEEGKAEAGTFVAALGVADLLSAELFGLRIGDDAAEGES